jgi:hypothetical protein
MFGKAALGERLLVGRLRSQIDPNPSSAQLRVDD